MEMNSIQLLPAKLCFVIGEESLKRHSLYSDGEILFQIEKTKQI